MRREQLVRDHQTNFRVRLDRLVRDTADSCQRTHVSPADARAIMIVEMLHQTLRLSEPMEARHDQQSG